MAEDDDRSGYMTPREGAAWLGMGDSPKDGRRLRDRLLAKEARTGKRILVRLGHGKKCPRLGVTKAILRRHCCENWHKDRALSEALKGELYAIQQQQKIAQSERRALGARILKVIKRLAALENRLTKTVSDGE